MLPNAHIAHQIGDRVRLRIPARRGDAAFFARVESGLASCAGVSYVESNPLTGSLLLRHTGDLAAITRYAAEQQLFTLEQLAAPRRVALSAAASRIDQLDRALQQMTGGAFDLDELLFIGLLGAGAVQLVRGQPLGPTSALLAYAAAILAAHRARRS